MRRTNSCRGDRVWVNTLMALALAIIPESRVSVPLHAQAASASPTVDVEGTLEVQIEDADSGPKVHHFLHVGKKRLRLQFDAEPPHLLSGTLVKAHGRLDDENTLALSSASGGTLQAMALAGSNTMGEQKTVVIMVNFQDYAAVPYDWTLAYDTTFGTTSDFYRENSYGQTWLTGTVYGWYTLPMSSTSCDTNQMANLADQAVANQGIDLSPYSRRVYAFPKISACAWWGLGTVGGSPSRAWINGTYSLKVVAHELGHGFGDYHSRSQPCDLAAGCTTVEYGDDHDVMGNPSSGHFNAFQKERLGWLNYGSSPAIQTVSQTGTYWIDAYETPGSAPKAVKILKSIDGSGYKTWYYVESRTQTGFDGGVTPGVLVHTGSESTGNSSDEIDLMPDSTTADWMLDAGQSFSDASIGLSVTTVSAGYAGAWVSVTYAGLPCTTRAATLTLSPATTLMTSPGKSASYSVGLTNTDDAACASTSFALSPSAPAGWNAVVSNSLVTLAPGTSSSVSFSLTPAAGTVDGYYPFSLDASRTNTVGLGGSVSGGLSVASALVVSASATSNGSLSAIVKAGPAPVANASVVFTVKTPTGATKTLSAKTNSTGVASANLSLKPKDPRGTYQVQAVASSGALTGSASTSFVH